MLHRISFMVGALLLLFGGCVPSLHPLYTEDTLVFKPELIGSWAEDDDEDIWAFTQSDANEYELVYTEKETPARLEAHLVQLGEFLFLDLYPKEPELKNDLYKLHLIPAHTISRIWLERDQFRLAMLNHDWLETLLDENRDTIAHEVVDDTIILTASTAELQKFVLKYADDAKAFANPSELLRRE